MICSKEQRRARLYVPVWMWVTALARTRWSPSCSTIPTECTVCIRTIAVVSREKVHLGYFLASLHGTSARLRWQLPSNSINGRSRGQHVRCPPSTSLHSGVLGLTLERLWTHAQCWTRHWQATLLSPVSEPRQWPLSRASIQFTQHL